MMRSWHALLFLSEHEEADEKKYNTPLPVSFRILQRVSLLSLITGMSLLQRPL